MYTARNFKKISKLNSLDKTPKRGYKMTQLHFYTGSGPGTTSGIKACIFGSTASIGHKIAANLIPNGIPTVLVHRNPLDFFSPIGDDPLYSRSNPYHTQKEFVLNFDTFKSVFRINNFLGFGRDKNLQ